MSTVKGLTLLRYLSFGTGKKFHPGDYIGDKMPAELLAELEAGSRHVVEMQSIPSIAQAPAPKQELSKQQTVETTKEVPKKPAPPKPTVKSTRTSKTSKK